MCRRGPLTFADDGQSGAVNDEVQAGARAGGPKRAGEMLTASRSRGVIGGREIDAQPPDDRCQDALGLTQRYVEDEPERQGGFDGEIGILEGIVKLRLTAAFDAQYGGFATDWSPVSWGSLDELFVNLTMPRRDTLAVLDGGPTTVASRSPAASSNATVSSAASAVTRAIASSTVSLRSLPMVASSTVGSVSA